MSTSTRARQTGGGRVTAPRGGGGPQAAFAGLAVLAAVLLIMEACTAGASSTTSTAKTYPVKTPIKHVIVIMQENRSFDTYFGTFPGADGLPRDSGGHFTTCSPDPQTLQCVFPYHNPTDKNGGGPHGAPNAVADINGGQMNGFQAAAEKGQRGCGNPNDPACTNATVPDVMGYHDAREIPNYWRYAQDFVLQDHLFEPNASWSLPEHLFMVSEWSAKCSVAGDPQSCVNALQSPQQLGTKKQGGTTDPNYAWTDLTYLLHKYGVSWKYYLDQGTQPDCENDATNCTPGRQVAKVPEIWNPLPWFTTVKQDGQLGNIEDSGQFFADAKGGTLPAVSWVVPNGKDSEHPPALVSAGQAWVTSLINAVMQGPDWSSTAIFLAWDDWGGFYDHVKPPVVDQNGYGLRVPGLVISSFAKRGSIDHQTLSFDAYAKFIEDNFLGGQRIDPKTDGRPDPRPDVRENAPQLGNLMDDFDFTQPPRPPEPLPVNPPPGSASMG